MKDVLAHDRPSIAALEKRAMVNSCVRVGSAGRLRSADRAHRMRQQLAAAAGDPGL